ncbi:MAG: putative Ig domain-containing protein, partial [Kiritimatiellae bacterium]|nr:putative Ig domain-containing protein [Kiritimatiellia bacterium]
AKKSLKFTSATKKLAKTAMVGSPEKSVAIKVAASSATLTTLSAKGLPKGLTFDAAAGMIMGVRPSRAPTRSPLLRRTRRATR